MTAITIVGGKGGVGKTTVAAASALAAAAGGKRTLLMSTDPAHSLGDVFGVEIGDEAVELAPGLWVRQPDPDLAVRRRIEQVIEDAYRAVPPEIMPAVRRHLEQAAASPGMVESALADQLITAIEEVPQRWDRLVVDSAPTGHLLRMVSLPSLLTPWVQGLVRQREKAVRADRFAQAVAGSTDPDATDDPLLVRLHQRRHRLGRAADRLRGPDVLIRLVLVPRQMVIAETFRAAEELTKEQIPLGPAVINQIPEQVNADLLEAARSVAGPGAVEVPLLAEEPRGLIVLRDVAAMLDGDG